MTSRRVLAVLAGVFLVFGFLGVMLAEYEEPIWPIAFLTLGTGSVAFLAFVKK